MGWFFRETPQKVSSSLQDSLFIIISKRRTRKSAHNECVTRREQNTLFLMIQCWCDWVILLRTRLCWVSCRVGQLGPAVKVVICSYSQVLIFSLCVYAHAWTLFRVPLDAVKSTFFTFSLPLHLGRQVRLNRKREKVKHLRVSVVSWCRWQVWAGKLTVSKGLIPTRRALTFATKVVVLLILTVTEAYFIMITYNTSKFYNIQEFSLRSYASRIHVKFGTCSVSVHKRLKNKNDLLEL